jgi:hypothetical protein
MRLQRQGSKSLYVNVLILASNTENVNLLQAARKVDF